MDGGRSYVRMAALLYVRALPLSDGSINYRIILRYSYVIRKSFLSLRKEHQFVYGVPFINL